MADFSDLETTNIGIIAFWNAHDHRVVPGTGDVDPTDCIAVFDSYDVYDNGIEGYKAIGSGRYFHARVKTDGWIIAWIDRSNTFAYPNKAQADFGESGFKGYYDILYDWTNYVNISSTYTTLSYLIYLLYNALSNKTDFTFSAANVGHYCYEFPLAAALTLSSVQDSTGSIQYTTGTSIYYNAVAASGIRGAGTGNVIVVFEGHTLLNGVYPSDLVAAVDNLAENWMPDPLTDYTFVCTGAGATINALGAILLIWK